MIKKQKIKKYSFSKEELGKFNPISFIEDLKESMKDSKFREAYKNLESEYSLIRQIMESRIKKNISQKMLAKRLGTGQSAVSRLESGTYNPTFKFAQKLAKALETDLTITFGK
ncbi:MAG: helix-turn-helix domain-containing protein [Patescibacteria group bacterium]